MAEPLRADDPAAWMLTKGMQEKWLIDTGQIKPEDAKHISKTTVYKKGCYICEDPEFALMGLPLCYPCPECGGHVPADDVTCENDHDAYPERGSDGTDDLGSC